MEVENTPLNSCFIVCFSIRDDERGSFMRSFDRSDFAKLGLRGWVDHTAEAFNHSRLTLRGMHFQASPTPDAKLVRCITGSVFDVVVDLRPKSATYQQWFGVTLNHTERHKALYVPGGFAHGYVTLSENTTLAYHLFAPYDPLLQRGFRFDDPDIGIIWPELPAVISERDTQLPSFAALGHHFQSGLSE